jgi:hypothetical protein
VNGAMSGTGHGAAQSALGYAYQAEAALVELVRRAKVEPATKLTIERYDDVAFETRPIKPRNCRSELIPIAACATASATSSASVINGLRPPRAGTEYSSAKT